MCPSRDPASTKYPGRVFFQDQWRTPEQIDQIRAYGREYNKKNQKKRHDYHIKYRQINRERINAQKREHDKGLSSLEYNKILLYNRRSEGLRRKAKRKATKTKGDDS